jgi:hypothetical protein
LKRRHIRLLDVITPLSTGGRRFVTARRLAILNGCFSLLVFLFYTSARVEVYDYN